MLAILNPTFDIPLPGLLRKNFWECGTYVKLPNITLNKRICRYRSPEYLWKREMWRHYTFFFSPSHVWATSDSTWLPKGKKFCPTWSVSLESSLLSVKDAGCERVQPHPLAHVFMSHVWNTSAGWSCGQTEGRTQRDQILTLLTQHDHQAWHKTARVVPSWRSFRLSCRKRISGCQCICSLAVRKSFKL